MAPITQETVDGLKDIIHKLESRVADLEGRLVHGGNDSKTPSISEQVRIILMGPPGAGACYPIPRLFSSNLTCSVCRQGNPSAPDQGQVLRVPFGRFSLLVGISFSNNV